MTALGKHFTLDSAVHGTSCLVIRAWGDSSFGGRQYHAFQSRHIAKSVSSHSIGIMAVSALLRSRVRRPSMLNKLIHIDDLDLPGLFPHGSYIGWSGFTGVGYPKLDPSRFHTPMAQNADLSVLEKSLQLSRTMSRKTAYKGNSNIPCSLVPQVEQRPRIDGRGSI